MDLLIIKCSITACSTSSLSVTDYFNWVTSPARGLHHIKSFGTIDFSLQYKPLEYIYAQENEDKALNSENLNAKLKQQNGMEFYTLRIATNRKAGDVLLENSNSQTEYYQRTDYYSFGF